MSFRYLALIIGSSIAIGCATSPPASSEQEPAPPPTCSAVGTHLAKLVPSQKPADWPAEIEWENDEDSYRSLCKQELDAKERRCVMDATTESEINACADWDSMANEGVDSLRRYAREQREAMEARAMEARDAAQP